MHTRLIVSAALASALASGLTIGSLPAAQAQAAAKEKCYGIAKPGSNYCANLSGSHSCAGQAKAANGVDEWNYVPKGTCTKIGGMSAEDARAALQKS